LSKVIETIPKAVNESLQASGFPFQTAIRHVITSCKGWAVHASEYPWLNSHNGDNFLDIVATNGRFILTVECKKTRHEILTFLLPLGEPSTGPVDTFRGVQIQYFPEQNRANHAYEKWNILPRSCSSEFCIVSPSKSGKDQGRLLERDASLLVRATDAFAADKREHPKLPDEKLPRVLLPVIVTNDEIYTVCYKPTEVLLETGEFNAPPKDIEAAPWVRFSKSFTADMGRDVGHRSVFVVNAASFGDFLEKLEMAPR
jgi:hypothetical protein